MKRLALKLRARLKDSLALTLVQDKSAPLVKSLPIENWPSWLGHIHEIRVPSNQSHHQQPSPTGAANINNILTLLKQSLSVDGDVAECGVYRGGSLLTMGLYLKQNNIGKKLFGFDSFEGFPEAVQVDVTLGGASDEQKRVGGFGDTNYARLCERIADFDLADTIQLRKGFFDETLAQAHSVRFCFVHLDVDIYSSYKTCMEFFYPRLAEGGVILFDEYNDPPWPGCNKAIDEFLADKPERPIAIQANNFIKYYVRKERDKMARPTPSRS